MSIQRPATYINWTDGAPSKVVQPDASFLLTGWQAGQAPPPQYMNWAFYELDQWVQYLDQITNAGVPDGAIRLLNGGNWSFDATTGALSWDAAANLAIPSIPDSSNVIAASSVTLNDGDVAYITPNTPIIAQGTTFSGLTLISPVNFTGNISVGMNVTGPGIPSGTTVLGVGSNNVTLSAAATSSNTGATYVFSEAGPITVSTSTNEAFIPSINTVLFARRSGNAIYLGVNAAQMVLLDGESKTLEGYGYFSVFKAPAGQDLTAGQVVYISAGITDGGRTAGALYPLDCGADFAPTRSTYAGVVITDVLSGGTAAVVYNGFHASSGLTAGAVYYADPSTPGGITPHAPTLAGQKIAPVGFAVTASLLLYTGAAGGGGSQTFPLFFNEPPQFGAGGNAVFNLTSVPLSAGALFAFVDGGIVPNTKWTYFAGQVTFNAGSEPADGVEVLFSYVLAQQAYIAANQEIPVGLCDGTNRIFTLAGVPVNKPATFVYVNGQLVSPNIWSLTQGFAGSIVTFNVGSQPALSQDVYVTYFTGVAASGGGGGSVAGAANLGSGVGVFSDLLGSVLRFKSILQGTGTNIVDDGLGNIVVSAIPSPGGGAEVHGSKSAPIAVDPAVGIEPSGAMDQVWWMISTVAGAQPITAPLNIAAGVTVGQRLTIFGADPANYLIVQDAMGTDQNGNISLNSGQAITYYWDGANWAELSRRA